MSFNKILIPNLSRKSYLTQRVKVWLFSIVCLASGEFESDNDVKFASSAAPKNYDFVFLRFVDFENISKFDNS